MNYMDHEQALARAELIKRLENWPKRHTAVLAERDTLIKQAAEDGMSNAEIAEHMEISRTTVISVRRPEVPVLGSDDEEG